MIPSFAFLGLSALVLLAGHAQGDDAIQESHSLIWSFLATITKAQGEKDAEAAKARIADFEKALATSFTALPKNEQGRLELPSARYILHRLIVQRHGWHIKGLEPGGDLFSSNAAEDAEKDWVPNSLLSIVQEQKVLGVTLRDLAVLGAAVEERANKDTMQTMRTIYEAIGVKAEEPLNMSLASKAIDTYIALYLGNGVWSVEQAARGTFAGKHAYWKGTKAWFQPIEDSVLLPQKNEETGQFPFSAVVQVAQAFAGQYSGYNDKECHHLKEVLMGAWSLGPALGRLRLADFYKMGLQEEFNLVDSQEFLQTIGALDVSNQSMPMLVIANYLTSSPNCLKTPGGFLVCCRNECEDLLGHLESEIGAPSAEPAQVLELVRHLDSETVSTPRELPKEIEQRLTEIATRHGGKVPLHGRLFAQWMHHAYPSECPYPFEAGSAAPLTEAGADSEATKEEMQRHAAEADSCSAEQAAAEWSSSELPWSEHEELLSSDTAAPPASVGATAASEWASTCRYILLLALSMGAALLVRAGRTRSLSPRGMMVAAGVLLLIAFGANVVNRFLTLLMLACIVLAAKFQAQLPKAVLTKQDQDKSFV